MEGRAESTIIMAAQLAQDAQAGYACDYSNKRQPMAFNEVKECCKGHSDLSARLQGQSINKVGKRHALRLMSDAYGKGIVRGQTENRNLCANHKENDVTHAETFRTSPTEAFMGREYVSTIELLNDKRRPDKVATFGEIDARNPKRRRITIRDVATLYGQRPRHPEMWCLSPYEFVMYWEPQLASYPLALAGADNAKHHVDLTASGRTKLQARADSGESNDLQAGVDYIVRAGGPGWVAYPDVPAAKHFRHTWVLTRRRRPVTPSFAGAPLPRHGGAEQQRAALIIMSYFHPWTLRHADAQEHVPYAGALRHERATWQEVMCTWFDGKVLCAEAKRYVGNFLSVHRVRPTDDGSEDGNSDDIISDEELQVSQTTLAEALATRIGGREGTEAEEEEGVEGGASHYHKSLAAMTLGQDVWKSEAGDQGATAPEFDAPASLEAIFAAATASQKRARPLEKFAQQEARDASLRAFKPTCAADVQGCSAKGTCLAAMDRKHVGVPQLVYVPNVPRARHIISRAESHIVRCMVLVMPRVSSPRSPGGLTRSAVAKVKMESPMQTRSSSRPWNAWGDASCRSWSWLPRPTPTSRWTSPSRSVGLSTAARELAKRT